MGVRPLGLNCHSPRQNGALLFKGAYERIALENQLRQDQEAEARRLKLTLQRLATKQQAAEAKLAGQRLQLDKKQRNVQAAAQAAAELKEKQLAFMSETVMEYNGHPLTGLEALLIMQKMPKVSAQRGNAIKYICGTVGMTAGMMTLPGGLLMLAGNMQLGAIVGVWTALLSMASLLDDGNNTAILSGQTRTLLHDALTMTPTTNLEAFLPKLSATEKTHLVGRAKELGLIETRALQVDTTKRSKMPITSEFYRLSPRGKELLKRYRAEVPEKLQAEATAIRKQVQMGLSKEAIRTVQLRVLLKESAMGLTGFEMLQKIAQTGAQKWLWKNSVSQTAVLATLGLQGPHAELFDSLHQTGYLIRAGGGDANPKWALSPSAKALLAYPSTEALITHGMLTKEDLHQFLQSEIDVLTLREQERKATVAELEEAIEKTLSNPQGMSDRLIQEHQVQAELARYIEREHEAAVQSAVASLKEQQAHLDLNENNERLLGLLKESQHVVARLKAELGTIGKTLDGIYHTNRELLAPEEQLAQFRLKERIQARVTLNAQAALRDSSVIMPACIVEQQQQAKAEPLTHSAKA